MKVFVTGATGYIGFTVASAFRRSGAEVSGLARSEQSAARLWQREIVPVIGNLADPRSFEVAAHSADVIVHCAADSSKDRAELDRRATEAMLNQGRAGEGGRTFIYTSGCWVYGSTAGRVASETSSLTPATIVTWRPAVERMVLEASSDRLHTIVMRPGCVYGGSGGLTSAWFASAEKEGAAKIAGNGSNRWATIHVEDIASAYLRAAALGVRAEVFNLADASRATVREMAEAASHAAGAGGRVTSTNVDTPFGEALGLDQKLDASKAADMLGWTPRHLGFSDQARLYFGAWKHSAK